MVFKGGEGALQVLPQLLETPPEARLNLVIFHLHNGEVEEAYNLVKELEPSTAPEYIIKAVVHISVGQAYQDSQEHLKLAQQHYKVFRRRLEPLGITVEFLRALAVLARGGKLNLAGLSPSPSSS